MYNRATDERAWNKLDLSFPHRITIASYNFYSEASLHPDRVMTQHDIFYVIDGSWEVTQNGESYPLEKDDVIFLFAGQRHWGARHCSPNTKTLFIHFTANDADGFGEKGHPRKEEDACVYLPVKIHCKNFPLVKKYFETLNYLYWSEESLREKKMEAYTDLLFCELHAAANEDVSDQNEVIAGVIREINANPRRFYKLDELAEEFFISRRTLINLFRKYVGTSPHSYQVNMKLDICRDLLQNEPDLRMKEVAERFGFCDEFHFSRLFKKRFGVSPKHMRGTDE